MQCSINETRIDAVANRAIMLYETLAVGSAPSTVLATVHDIRDCGAPGRPNIQIMPGVPISMTSLLEAVDSLSAKLTSGLEIMPETVLVNTSRHLMWWRPAGNMRVAFRNPEIGTRSEIVPLPPLVFIVIDRDMYVYAMKENIRPTNDTKLFHSTFFNVYGNGKVCTGSMKMPARVLPSNVAAYENEFFDAPFTHTNFGDKGMMTTFKGGDYAFWKQMLDGKFDAFPTEVLISVKALNLAQVFTQVTQGKNS